ncbi:hypothetical protein, partial [uncultured Duncaniella sp.]|uniref:hypothetical protein n=1 Tax=uncultured Duncaniella sp. TaxID=2768039 RepID=UPI0026F1E5E8
MSTLTNQAGFQSIPPLNYPQPRPSKKPHPRREGRAPTAVVQQHHPSPRPANNHPRREGACPHRRRPTTSSLTSPR